MNHQSEDKPRRTSEVIFQNPGDPCKIFLEKTPQGRQLAVKEITFSGDGPSLEEVRNEVDTLRQLSSHPNIIRLLHYEEADGKCRLEFPYYKNNLGKLAASLSSREMALSQANLLDISQQILQALQYMHSKDYLHLDIKPENIMVDIEDHKYICKLIDFGSCHKKSEVDGSNRLSGSPGYCSPEQLGFSSQDSKVTEKSDVFSFGATLFSLVYNQHPYVHLGINRGNLSKENQNEAYMQAIKAGSIRKRTSGHPVLDALIDRCMKFEASERPDIAELLTHQIDWSLEGLKPIEFDINKMADITYEGLDSINFTGGETQKKHYVDKLNELRPKYPKVNKLTKRNAEKFDWLKSEKRLKRSFSQLSDLNKSLCLSTVCLSPEKDIDESFHSKSMSSVTDFSSPMIRNFLEESDLTKINKDRESPFLYIGETKSDKRHGFGVEFFKSNPSWLYSLKIISKADRQLETYIGCFKDDLPDGMNNVLIFKGGIEVQLSFEEGRISGAISTKITQEQTTKEFRTHKFGKEMLSSRLTIRRSDLKGQLDFDEYVGSFEQTEDIYPTSFKKGKLLRSATGVTFEGDWSSYKDGKGTITYSAEERYTGEWKNLVRHGTGTWEKKDCQKYTGQFLEDRFHGQGVLVDLLKETEYDGEFVKGLYHGRGALTVKSKDGSSILSSYHGEFQDNAFHGKGKLFNNSSHTTIEGTFKKGRISEECEMTFHGADSKWNRFVGKFTIDKNTESPSYGTLYYSCGKKYHGYLMDLKPHGKGKMNFSTGKYLMYDGEWHQGAFQGQGKLLFKDGREYKGHFQDNDFQGQGVLRFYNHPLIEYFQGTFSEGDLSHGKFFYTDGSIYEGKFKQGKLHGDVSCKFLFNQGDIFEGPMNQGEPAGFGSYFRNEPPEIIESVFGKGFKCGSTIETHRENTIIKIDQPTSPPGKGNVAITFSEYEFQVSSLSAPFENNLINGQGELVLNENAGDLAGSYTGVFKISKDLESVVREISVSCIETEGDITVHYQNGDRFKGKMCKLRPENGEYEKRNGEFKYIGEFEQPDPDTPFNMTRPDSNDAVMTFANKDKFSGSFQAGRINKGVYFYFGASSGVKINEKFSDKEKNSESDLMGVFAEHQKNPVFKLEGMFSEGKIRDGKAKATLKDGGEFVGNFKDGEQVGEGSLTYSNQIFSGYFKDYQIVYGTMKDTDANIEYEEEIDPQNIKFFKSLDRPALSKWQEGSMQPKIIEPGKLKSLKTGDWENSIIRYDGQFLNGKFHGKGICLLSNLDMYIGWFHEGRFHTPEIKVEQEKENLANSEDRESLETKGKEPKERTNSTYHFYSTEYVLEAHWKEGKPQLDLSATFHYPKKSDFDSCSSELYDDNMLPEEGLTTLRVKEGDPIVSLLGRLSDGLPHGDMQVIVDGPGSYPEKYYYEKGVRTKKPLLAYLGF